MASNFFNKASLVMVPDAPIDGKLPSVKPEDRSGDFTFSRGSNLAATRVNKSGLIEKGRENLLLQSNQFDTSWVTNTASVTSGQADKDGGTSAWKLQKSGANGRIYQSVISNGVHTFSVYAKAGDDNWAYLVIGSSAVAYFDLANGAIGTKSSEIDAKIESYGDYGFYRISLTFNHNNPQVRIYPADGDGDVSGTSGSIYIQDAQLEQGLAATEYIETTTAAVQKGILENLPRLDYSGGASCPSLLLEPQRTNSINKSEYFGGYAVGGGAGFVITDNYGISPEGVQNACRIQYTSGNKYILSNSPNITIGQKITMSIYAKGTAGEQFRLYCDGNGGAAINTEFTLTGNWKRYDVTSSAATANGVVTPHILVGYGSSNPANDFQVYGWQGEIGASYPTSYIPTYGSSVTRSTDSCQIASGISDLLPQGTGTMYVEATMDDAVDTEGYLMRIEQASFANSIFIARSTAGNLFASYRNNNSTIFGFQKNNVADTFKAAFAFESGNSVLYVNGEKISASSVTYTPAVTYDDLRVGGFTANTANMSGVVSQAMVFKTRLTDDECIALTTI